MPRILLALLCFLIAMPAQASTPWSRPAATTLLDYGRKIDSHGLDPRDYELDRLRGALEGGDQRGLDIAATRSFALMARDLANGRVPVDQRRLSYFRTPNLSPDAVLALIDRALSNGDVAAELDRLAPAHPDYRRLRAALLSLPADAAADRARLRANLERWRWLPRNMGSRYLIVNVPEYVAQLVDRGAVLATHRVIVGKLGTPTPQFTTTATGVILNPTWTVPQSIVRESVGALIRTRPATARARGYSWTQQGSGLQVVQQPGPSNALGQMKIDMPNPLAIFLHDTPSKSLFEKEERTFSHGCVRTEQPFDLAVAMLAGTEWTRAQINAAVAAGTTVTAKLSAPIPVYIVYMTARADAKGRLNRFDDVYGLDGDIAAALGAGNLAATRQLSSMGCLAG
ncbi:murein L,D-transpeptidase YcbB/YkuD [Sphingobium sp. B1D7B]|uniref:L,D-transpeptidase family protein n=1 Tax=unclassified Sphingobium TaxID=2611147 RepID=UPI00222576A5|nr:MULTISPECIES: L,D-transpeptidase family protein [unclassified Sphingobium]MCW2392463.1 murein L,D-transpeptidase YcbB/YkuD [Sphingobium sp. B11D3A]MCW2404158.1 murein L,D-transpeptidase YcbB/YkuD [Sphingobium sp. B1D7B]